MDIFFKDTLHLTKLKIQVKLADYKDPKIRSSSIIVFKNNEDWYPAIQGQTTTVKQTSYS